MPRSVNISCCLAMWYMVIGQHLYTLGLFYSYEHSKRFTMCPHIHPFTHLPSATGSNLGFSILLMDTPMGSGGAGLESATLRLPNGTSTTCTAITPHVVYVEYARFSGSFLYKQHSLILSHWAIDHVIFTSDSSSKCGQAVLSRLLSAVWLPGQWLSRIPLETWLPVSLSSPAGY